MPYRHALCLVPYRHAVEMLPDAPLIRLSLEPEKKLQLGFRFLVQMTTLRALHAPNMGAALAAKARFGRFFAGALADTYLGLAHEAPNVWPAASAGAAARAPPVCRA